MLRFYRGIPVAVREYETSIANETRTVLSLPSHPCFPVLVGVCCDTKPYLLVTIFYGILRKGVYMSVSGLLQGDTDWIDILQWTSILLDIAKGLFQMHSCGFVHGELKAENIILRKQKVGSYLFSPVFLNLEKAKALDRDVHGLAYKQDFDMFGCLIDNIITAYNNKDAVDLSGLKTVLELVQTISVWDLCKVVTKLIKMLPK